MIISKVTLEACFADLPDTVDTEELMYRLYLMEKIETAEEDLRNGKTLSHTEVQQRIAQKWQS
ncbi:MAG: hypothetical protein A2075_20665 [Geobacteraceae bacterium GWC2_58_44]|nr:MAG: hypothetical protein A2075_20665 [Geobacteraceae bacterium GWC2_58_44]HBG05308.1 hypothetical protein [Geobacter sp.]